MKITMLTFSAIALFFTSSCNREREIVDDAAKGDPLQSHNHPSKTHGISIHEASNAIPSDVILHLQKFNESRILREGDSVFFKFAETKDDFYVMEIKNVKLTPSVDIIEITEADKLNGILEKFGFYYELSTLTFPARTWENGRWGEWREIGPTTGTLLPVMGSYSNTCYFLERTAEGLRFTGPVLPSISDTDLGRLK